VVSSNTEQGTDVKLRKYMEKRASSKSGHLTELTPLKPSSLTNWGRRPSRLSRKVWFLSESMTGCPASEKSSSRFPSRGLAIDQRDGDFVYSMMPGFLDQTPGVLPLKECAVFGYLRSCLLFLIWKRQPAYPHSRSYLSDTSLPLHHGLQGLRN
jgi:hypothetical protein